MSRPAVWDRIKQSRVVRMAGAVSERYRDDGGPFVSGAIAFYGFLSLFPLLLLGLSVSGFILAGRPGAQGRVAERVAAAVPGVENLVGDNLQALIRARTGTGILALLGLVWTGSGVVRAARYAVRTVFREPPIDAGVKRRLWLVAITAGLGVVALSAAGLAALVGALNLGGPLGVALAIVIPVVVGLLDFLVFLATYRALLRRPRPLGQLVPGAVFAAIGWAGLKLGGSWYAGRTVGNASAVYGTFATTVGVMVLLFLAARLFVYGAELNAVLLEEGRRGGIGMQGDRVERERAAVRGDGGVGAGDASTGRLVRAVSADAVLLVRKEVELAKQEVKEGVAAKAIGGAAMGIAGLVALVGVVFLGAAMAAALDAVLQPWASRLVVAGTFLVLAAVAAVVGRSRLKGAPVAPRRAKENLKEDVRWAKAQLRR
jgi:membrane protein